MHFKEYVALSDWFVSLSLGEEGDLLHLCVLFFHGSGTLAPNGIDVCDNLFILLITIFL